MARRFTAAVQQLKAQLHAHLTPADIHAACQAAGYNWRQRVLGPVLTIQALLLQLLHGSAMTGVSRLTGVAFSAGPDQPAGRLAAVAPRAGTRRHRDHRREPAPSRPPAAAGGQAAAA